MSEAAWKKGERRVAKLLGGKRNPRNGSASVDVERPDLAVEVKLRKDLPQWIKAALASAQGKAKRGQVGMCVLKEKGSRDGYVIISLRDFALKVLPRGGGE